MAAGTPTCAPDLDRIAGPAAKAGQVPHARPLPVSGPAECTHAADAGGSAGWPGQRAAVAARSVIPSERADVLRLRSLRPLGRVELDLLVLIQRPVAGARDRGEVHEHVRRSVIGGDETKALIGVEPLHSSCCHQSTSSVHHVMTRPAAPTASLPVLASRYRVHPQSPSSAALAAAPAQHPHPRQCPAPSPA